SHARATCRRSVLRFPIASRMVNRPRSLVWLRRASPVRLTASMTAALWASSAASSRACPGGTWRKQTVEKGTGASRSQSGVASVPAGERCPEVGVDRDGSGVGRVDVEPQALAGGDVGNRRDRVHRGGRGRPDGGHDRDRGATGGPVFADRSGEGVGPQLEAL